MISFLSSYLLPIAGVICAAYLFLATLADLARNR